MNEHAGREKEIEARHQKEPDKQKGAGGYSRCAWCWANWPCDATYLLAQLEELKVPVPDNPNPCPRCGRRYGLDASVSNEDWFRITGHKNGGGHLCLWCMDALAVEKGLSGIHCTLTFAGRAIWSDDDSVEEACQARARAGIAERRVRELEALARWSGKALVLAYANMGQENWARMTDRAKNTIINNVQLAEAQARQKEKR